MKIKLIALDLDGTTLRKGSVLSERTRHTLEEAINRGVHVVVATGRVFSALPDTIFDIEGLEYIITSNGAHITRLKDMKQIYFNYPDENAIEQVGDFLAVRKEFPVEVFTCGKAYIDRTVYEDVRDNGSDYMDAKYIVKTRNPVDDIYGFLKEHRREIENINIHFRNFDDKAELKKLLALNSEITVTSSMPHNLEIGGKTTSKAKAIAALCEILGIDEKNVLAAGDSPNDEAMIKAAGIGVAMGNAEEEVKACADFVTLTNQEDGVAYAIEKFVFDRY
ncbi:MAG: Cof-type HAD-IIB family hydrolase [Clostridiales bacterium]|nr:HAD family phosphatase [Bacillota bacterium]MEE0516978.1 Cof-type HAD-IIB family hydrolase [Anaerovoracaceae bacterium]PWL94505.1 MAG: Cof-type HAD-IIB family hydrolase [Clostridiales bacterium]